ncbi:MAG: hypothetical protein ABI183_00685 [Polyangiaceae bacterium]
MIGSVLAACGGTIAPVDETDSTPDAGTSSSGGGSITRDAGRAKVDSGVTTIVDASVCIDLDPADYDTSCNADTDCIDITAGEICSGYNCTCGGATISTKDQDKYDALFNSIHPSTGPICSCPYFGTPRCVQGTCTFCPRSDLGGPIPAGCPDAG